MDFEKQLEMCCKIDTSRILLPSTATPKYMPRRNCTEYLQQHSVEAKPTQAKERLGVHQREQGLAAPRVW